MNADVVLRGTHTYFSAAENPSTAIDTLCAIPSLGSDTLPSTRYASDSGFLSSTEPSGSSIPASSSASLSTMSSKSSSTANETDSSQPPGAGDRWRTALRITGAAGGAGGAGGARGRAIPNKPRIGGLAKEAAQHSPLIDAPLPTACCCCWPKLAVVCPNAAFCCCWIDPPPPKGPPPEARVGRRRSGSTLGTVRL